MKTKLIQGTVLISLMILTTFSSCSKEEDIEAIYEDLNNTYITSVNIINVPPYYWDNGSSPDLQLKLALEPSSTWTYITNRIDNVETVPTELSFDEDIKITNENWQLELIDYDDLNSDDIIYNIVFNPWADASGGKIPIYSNGLLVMEFNYYKKN